MFLGLDPLESAILAITAIIVATVVGMMLVTRPSQAGRLPSSWRLVQRRYAGEGHRPRPHGRSHRA